MQHPGSRSSIHFGQDTGEVGFGWRRATRSRRCREKHQTNQQLSKNEKNNSKYPQKRWRNTHLYRVRWRTFFHFGCCFAGFMYAKQPSRTGWSCVVFFVGESGNLLVFPLETDNLISGPGKRTIFKDFALQWRSVTNPQCFPLSR